jgi:hypothetical protein
MARPRIHVGVGDQWSPVALCRIRRGRWPLVVVAPSLPPHPAIDCRRCLASLRVLRHAQPIARTRAS